MNFKFIYSLLFDTYLVCIVLSWCGITQIESDNYRL